MTYKQFVLFLLVLMAISNAGPVYADSSIAANGQPAQARVHFKIVIAPGLVLNMDQLYGSVTVVQLMAGNASGLKVILMFGIRHAPL